METPYPNRIILAAILILLAGCRGAPVARDMRAADIRTIKEAEILWARNWSIRDVDRILAHYSEDAIWMGPHFPFANGREAIRELVQRLIEDGSFSVTFEAAHVDAARSGELAYSQGVYTLTVTDPVSKQPVTDKGSYLRLYRKESNGIWRVFQEINSSSPTNAPVVR